MSVELFIAIRKLNGLTQYAMAERVGISRGYIAKIEGMYAPYPEFLNDRLRQEFGAAYVAQVSELTRAKLATDNR
ncbi:helix-turn-helix domain-containing protein [Salimicrobium humidisoli]|uniref:HTH cro/C1-type domain-containing protein n=1 Tax=Salimicrobium humidisoli TaxID=2029857 RepID=A0ABX4HRB1_9BACI|nr:helix-turn-helix transcriptional regulator [Salimicrobium humidisoli]PBB05746.1 hypothetical protein CKW00_07025 [Salimicrobium humidisoli]